ncbi:hypothetical protein ACMHYB_07165 [Sorangium sp. So ce1128]
MASCNWEHGIAAALRQVRPTGVFFSPPLDGKVLVVEYMPLKRNKWDASHLQFVLGGLSRELGGRVCMFESHRGVSAAAWAVAEQGELIRAYAHCDGTTALDFGLPLAQEKALSFLYMDDVLGDPDADDDLWDRLPDESTILKLAGLLSLDPSTLEGSYRDHFGTGLLVY